MHFSEITFLHIENNCKDSGCSIFTISTFYSEVGMVDQMKLSTDDIYIHETYSSETCVFSHDGIPRSFSPFADILEEVERKNVPFCFNWKFVGS